MRILPFLAIAATALVLTACNDQKPRRASPTPSPTQASTDCCCKEICPNPTPGTSAPVVGTLEQEGIRSGVNSGGHGRRVSGDRQGRRVYRVAHAGQGGYRYRSRSGTEGVGYLDEDLASDAYGYRRGDRSGTEGVGYLDEGQGGAYYRKESRPASVGGGYRVDGRGEAYRGGQRRGVSVRVDERETYSESARYSESESGYSYSSGGGVVVYGEGRRGGHGKHGRRGGGGYAGVDRDGYLTWPGKTE